MGGRRCTVCAHRECAAINLAISHGISSKAIAGRYGLGHDAVLRHSQNHLPPQLRAKLIAGPELGVDLDKLRSTE